MILSIILSGYAPASPAGTAEASGKDVLSEYLDRKDELSLDDNRDITHIAKKDYVGLTAKSEILWTDKEFKSSIKTLRLALKAYPEYPIGRFFLGRAYVFEKKIEKAKAEFSAFLDGIGEPDLSLLESRDLYISMLTYLSYIYYTQKDLKEAEEICDKIISIDPKNQSAHYNLAVCHYIIRRNRQKAYEELNKVIDIDKDSYLATRAKLYIEYLRKNPDPRFEGDFRFLNDEEW